MPAIGRKSPVAAISLMGIFVACRHRLEPLPEQLSDFAEGRPVAEYFRFQVADGALSIMRGDHLEAFPSLFWSAFIPALEIRARWIALIS